VRGGVRDHRELQVFQLADGLVTLVYQATRGFPREEEFGLAAQKSFAPLRGAPLPPWPASFV
jgi:hypothetical protein